MIETRKRTVATVITDEGLALLRTKSVEVPFTVLGDGGVCLDIVTNELIEDLKRFVMENNGLGMSAIQLGIAKRIFVMRRKTDEIIIVINPKIVERSDEYAASPEGCFSIPLMPGVGAIVSRSTSISVQYDTETGDHVSTQLTGMEARIFQHETDHLEGNLMIDKDKLNGWSSL